MKKQIYFIMFIILLLPWGCTVPQYIWPQGDMGFQEINPSSLEKKILIASRKSEFKDAIVQKIEEAFKGHDVYIRITGIENLKNEEADQYSAIVLINTAMGWKIDRKVKSFLDKHKDLDSIIVLTTSGGGDIMPDTKKYRIDAVSAASTKDETKDIANEIISKVYELIEQ